MAMLAQAICVLFSVALSAPDVDINPSPNERSILQTLFSYLSDHDLATLGAVSDSLSIADLYNPETYKSNNTDWETVLQEYKANASDACEALNISSTACLNDCIYYNSILNWIPLITAPANDTAAKAELNHMISLYAMSGKFLSYQDVGNPDMCSFSGGTYCYTPALFGTYAYNQHAC